MAHGSLSVNAGRTELRVAWTGKPPIQWMILYNGSVNASVPAKFDIKKIPTFSTKAKPYNGWWKFTNIMYTTTTLTFEGKGSPPGYVGGGTYALATLEGGNWNKVDSLSLEAEAEIQVYITHYGEAGFRDIAGVKYLQFPREAYNTFFITDADGIPNRGMSLTEFNSLLKNIPTTTVEIVSEHTNKKESVSTPRYVEWQWLEQGMSSKMEWQLTREDKIRRAVLNKMSDFGVLLSRIKAYAVVDVGGEKRVWPLKASWKELQDFIYELDGGEEGDGNKGEEKYKNTSQDADFFEVSTSPRAYCDGVKVSTTGDGSYEEGSTAQISWSGTLSDCCEWAGWWINSTEADMAQSAMLVIDSPKTAVARFTQKLIGVEFDVYPVGAGILSLAASPAKHWTFCNNRFTISTEPREEFTFKQWVDENGKVVSTSPIFNVMVNKANKRFVAQFEPKMCKVWFKKQGLGSGEIIVRDKTKEPVSETVLKETSKNIFNADPLLIPYGSVISFTAKPNSGSSFFMWEGAPNKTDAKTTQGTQGSKYSPHQYCNPLTELENTFTAYFILEPDYEPNIRYAYRVNCPDDKQPIKSAQDCEVR